MAARSEERAREALTARPPRPDRRRRRELELALLARPEAFRRALGVYQAIPSRLRPEINTAFLPGGRRKRRR